MDFMATTKGYSTLQVTLHWLIVLLIGINYFISDAMARAIDVRLEGGAVTATAPWIHVYTGIGVLVLVLLRLGVRAFRGTPEHPDTAPAWTAQLANLSHWLLYGLLIVVPVLGLLAWFGGVAPAGDWHVIAMNALLILAGLHAVAALAHHYLLKDDVLRRMMRPQ
jgi:cytochrome b561